MRESCQEKNIEIWDLMKQKVFDESQRRAEIQTLKKLKAECCFGKEKLQFRVLQRKKLYRERRSLQRTAQMQDEQNHPTPESLNQKQKRRWSH